MSSEEEIPRRVLLGGVAAITGAAFFLSFSPQTLLARGTNKLDDRNETLVMGLVDRLWSDPKSIRNDITSLDKERFKRALLAVIESLFYLDNQKYQSKVFSNSPLRALAAIDESGRLNFSGRVLNAYETSSIRDGIRGAAFSDTEKAFFRAFVVQISVAAQREIDSLVPRR